MGQALCKRTLNIVECLNEKHGDRLRFYLSKADEAGGESDRQVNSAADLKRRVFPFIHFFSFVSTIFTHLEITFLAILYQAAQVQSE